MLFSEKHNRMVFYPRVAIVGGGIFGGTIAWVLAKNGFSVDLFEERNDIFRCASGINQFRLHRGYHYPRSKETILACLQGEREFRKVYGNCVIDDNHDHYYAIAKEDSLLNARQILKVWDEYGLEYENARLDVLDNKNIDKCVKVKESVFDPEILKQAVWGKMRYYNINVTLNKKTAYRDLIKYDLVVVATYAFNNALLEDFPQVQREYQFEIIEKLVLDLPEKYNKKSIVIQDGPFTCIDPFGRTGLTLMGNVVHAIHHSNIEKLPDIPEEFKKLTNNGIIKHSKTTNLNKFLHAAEKFFPGISREAKHVGSMYTIRTVLPYREYDDARPTLVEQIDRRTISVFSGKIPTCIDAANRVLAIARKMGNA